MSTFSTWSSCPPSLPKHARAESSRVVPASRPLAPVCFCSLGPCSQTLGSYSSIPGPRVGSWVGRASERSTGDLFRLPQRRPRCRLFRVLFCKLHPTERTSRKANTARTPRALGSGRLLEARSWPADRREPALSPRAAPAAPAAAPPRRGDRGSPHRKEAAWSSQGHQEALCGFLCIARGGVLMTHTVTVCSPLCREDPRRKLICRPSGLKTGIHCP